MKTAERLPATIPEPRQYANARNFIVSLCRGALSQLNLIIAEQKTEILRGREGWSDSRAVETSVLPKRLCQYRRKFLPLTIKMSACTLLCDQI